MKQFIKPFINPFINGSVIVTNVMAYYYLTKIATKHNLSPPMREIYYMLPR